MLIKASFKINLFKFFLKLVLMGIFRLLVFLCPRSPPSFLGLPALVGIFHYFWGDFPGLSFSLFLCLTCR